METFLKFREEETQSSQFVLDAGDSRQHPPPSLLPHGQTEKEFTREIHRDNDQEVKEAGRRKGPGLLGRE